ncbi:M3 family oligoendopeptidase, partial [bacterium]|nr:M3 family oligoendopeptidase [bacterium]
MYQTSGYISDDLIINKWSDIKPFFENLLNEKIENVADLESVILHLSEVLSVLHEQHARAYINMTCHTNNEDHLKRFEMFTTEISPAADKLSHEIEKKVYKSSFFSELPQERYQQLKKQYKRDIEIFREENVDLEAKVSTLSSQFSQCVGRLMVTLNGEQMTLPQAAVFLESPDRAVREETYLAFIKTRQTARDELNEILNNMIALRHKIARNAGYLNYRDYKHDDLHRFDYTVEDVVTFHESIKEHVIPLQRKIEEKQIERLGLEKDDFRPWDLKGKTLNDTALRPFTSGRELLDKTIEIFARIKPAFSANLKKMDEANLFDLESRPNKAPGGYNYGLEVTGMPFIFMNAAGVHTDVVTIMHEGGHAMHTFLTNDESLIQYRNSPAEVAEVASMAMELISSCHWDVFYNEKDKLKAQREHLEDIISVFSWVAVIDSFQHWLYTHAKHSIEERDECFDKLMMEFGSGLINWEGSEAYRRMFWQKQLHIFEVPFYYIEYAIAQLGALQIYKNYSENPEETLNAYIKGLSLGNSCAVPCVWEAMNIKFDFSAKN